MKPRAAIGVALLVPSLLAGQNAPRSTTSPATLPLYATTAPLELTLVTNLRALLGERDSTRITPFGATLQYQSEAGAPVTVPVTVQARGHFRRQAKNCDYPPLRIDLRRRDAEPTVFRGQTQIKVTTACRPGRAEYQQYVLLEYAAYQVHRIVDPLHYRTRLARITYRDSLDRAPTVTSWAILLEDHDLVASRYQSVLETRKGVRYDDLELLPFATTALFQYLVGNTDWSVGGPHNMTILRDSAVHLRAVAYDFDWTGVVNARYAFPDPRWKLSRVTDRLFIGPCLIADLWTPIIARFVAAKPAIDSLYAAVPGLEAKRAAQTLRFYDGFWRTVSSPKRVREEIVEVCGPR